ncbi:hypothetical protein FS749_016391 [Ceratobasidium sp. UAMH 11750]|nr:hypothetical protein FS749_016391 [Ceratobasidium sp. UAMH 11750]
MLGDDIHRSISFTDDRDPPRSSQANSNNLALNRLATGYHVSLRRPWGSRVRMCIPCILAN